jgi:hypothetical protein
VIASYEHSSLFGLVVSNEGKSFITLTPIFYEQIFCTKVFYTAFMCSQFGFVIFWQKDSGAKAANKIMEKLTPGLLHLLEGHANFPGNQLLPVRQDDRVPDLLSGRIAFNFSVQSRRFSGFGVRIVRPDRVHLGPML